MTQAEEKALYDGYNRIIEPMRNRIFYEDYPAAKTFLWSMASCLAGGSENPGELNISSAISLYVDIHIRKHAAYMKPLELKDSINGKYNTLRQTNEKNFDNAVNMALEYIYSHEPGIREKDATLSVMDNMIRENAEINSGADTKNMNDADWGLVPEKPIFVSGFDGIRWYMAHLLTPDGKTIMYNRLGSTQVAGIAGPVDIYDIIVDNKKYKQICICLYGKTNSMKAPEGFVFEENPRPELYGRQDIRRMGGGMPELGTKKEKKTNVVVPIIVALVVIALITGIIIAINIG